MKTTHLIVFPAFFALALPLPAQERTAIDPARDCSSMVQFELGDTQFQPGDSITVREVRGNTNLIQAGGTYCVTGTYTLASQDEASLSFFATTTNRTSSSVNPAQTVRVTKGTGSFSLAKHMTDDGYLHLSFYSRKNGQDFGGVYFGQGEWVLHNRHFSSHQPVAHSASSDDEPVSSAAPNQVLFKYLGNPVPAPATMDPAYTKEGLERAMKTAAQNAGLTLKKLEIDDSEFPFFVGFIFANPGDKPKLMQQIRKMPSYEISAGVGDEMIDAMNIVRYNAFPGDRINRRMMLRLEMLHEKLMSAK